MAHVCLVRVDRIGDLVLTIPVEKILKQISQDDCKWLVSKPLKFILDHAENVSEGIYVESVSGFRACIVAAHKLRDTIKQEKFDEVIFFHGPWWVAYAFWLAGVKSRVGSASQWYSWLFFNKRLRQKRSEAIKHESKYNKDLILFAREIKSREFDVEPLRLNIKHEEKSVQWKQFFLNRDINLEKLVVIHPGMLGSALNWPGENYKKLSVKLLEQGCAIAVTGSESDRSFIESTGLLNLKQIINLVGITPGDEILYVLNLAQVVVVPSTGVAHLSASLQKNVVALYSLVKVQAPLRWAPLGKKVTIFTPPMAKPDQMQEIDVNLVASCVIQKLC
jgi:heptosyltransferase I